MTVLMHVYGGVYRPLIRRPGIVRRRVGIADHLTVGSSTSQGNRARTALIRARISSAVGGTTSKEITVPST